MQNLFVSFLRTVVPIVAGAILGAAARIGWDLDDAQVMMYVTAGLAAAYYAAFRLLEELAERMAWEPLRLVAGVLLGWARPPQYPGKRTGTVTIDLTAVPEKLQQMLRDVARGPGAGGGGGTG